ncbi:4-hydroxythreonine-4-phosphate dehydrogenase PdxA [Bacteroidota bacterium]
MEKEENIAHNKKPVIGITLGDINGIGPEVIIKALSDNRILNFITPVIYGSTKVLSYYRKNFGLEEFNYSQSKDGHINHKKTNVVNCWEDMVEIKMGQETEEGGQCAFVALEKGTEDLLAEKLDALVTGPINKKNIQREGFHFPGQTEYLAQKSGDKDSLMMMVSDTLKVGLVTTHVPVSKISEIITKEKISAKLDIMIQTLRKDFGISKPKIAILALNPHAGEEGLLGTEENDIIKPVVDEFKNRGSIVLGPYPADGFFGVAQYRNFDGIMAMYHDQGLIPFKSLSFESGVNYTAGLKFIRTSPDHGTAYNLTGKNIASEVSIREAIFLARQIVLQRGQNMSEADIS